jgi:hypothetical protein
VGTSGGTDGGGDGGVVGDGVSDGDGLQPSPGQAPVGEGEAASVADADGDAVAVGEANGVGGPGAPTQLAAMTAAAISGNRMGARMPPHQAGRSSS